MKTFEVLWGIGVPPKPLLHERLERIHGGRFAVHQTETPRPGWQRAEPAENFSAIGVRGHRVDLRDPGVDRDRLSVNPDLARTIDELTAAGALGLEADEEYGVALVRESGRYVVQHAPPGR